MSKYSRLFDGFGNFLAEQFKICCEKQFKGADATLSAYHIQQDGPKITFDGTAKMKYQHNHYKTRLVVEFDLKAEKATKKQMTDKIVGNLIQSIEQERGE